VDDAGALALLHELSIHTGVPVLAVTHCTSSPYGCGCIDVINRAYGRPDIPIGLLQKPGFLDGSDGSKTHVYSRYLTEHYPNRFEGGALAPDAVEVMRDALSAQPDGSVHLVAIGPMPNLADFIAKREDRALIARKVARLIVMAGCCEEGDGLPRVEWNVEMDVPSARVVLRDWPTPIDFAPFETGLPVITGVAWHDMPEDHPVRKSYALHSPKGRNSWDLTAVWAALMPLEPYFYWEVGTVTMEADGQTLFAPDPNGRMRVLKLKQDPSAVAEALDAWMTGAMKP
jgi:hypothetical protein